MSNYVPMWQELGLDIRKHDMLLAGLGQAYQSLFLSQKNRPGGMGYFDFVVSEVHGLRIQELREHQQAGGFVVGSFCVFVPEELILSAGGVSVGLCAGAEFGYEAAEQYFPRNTCALIKSFLGFLLEKVCPYMAASDIIVGENTCDGKKKAYETFSGMTGRMHVMDLPQVKNEAGKALLKAEYLRFLKLLEEKSGKPVTVEALRKGIDIVNAKRRALGRLAMLRQANPAPISGLDSLLINQVSFYDNPVRFTESVGKICDELEARIEAHQGVFPGYSPRVVVSGCPAAVPNWKLHSLIEGAGAVVVGDESCVGDRGLRNEVNPSGETVDALIDRLVERYFQIDCAIFTPNPDRADHIRTLMRDTHAAGLIHYALQFCTPYQMESVPLERELEKAGIPTLRIETDYSGEDAGQLRTRIEAFLERIG
jgi:benzoyl-CoA reductase/2-hydroxyglutaryl-CoA dehydratase subunit BcrC/BadD/HgdB